VNSSQNKELLKTSAFTNGSDSCHNNVGQEYSGGPDKAVILASTIPHYIISRCPVIPLELESKGDAKCFGERREPEEGVFLS